MLLKKSIIASLATISLAVLPGLAFAGDKDLHVDNNTSKDSTTTIHGICSTTLLGADKGVTRHGDHNKVVTHTDLRIACGCIFSDCDCEANVYMTDNCTGDVVSVVKIHTADGLKSIDNKTTKYIVSGSGFNVKMDENS